MEKEGTKYAVMLTAEELGALEYILCRARQYLHLEPYAEEYLCFILKEISKL